MKIRRQALAAGGSGLLLLGLLSGCSGGAEGANTEAGGWSAVTRADVATALEYVGGEAGKADPALKPFTIGFVNGQGGVPSFKEQTGAAKAAVEFINEKLGGIDGHPVKLEKCFIKAEEDGQKCAAQLLNANVPIGVVGVSVYGKETFYNLVDGDFPVIVTAATNAADTTTEDVYVFGAGSLANLRGIAAGAEKASYDSLAVIASDNPAGKYLLSQIVLPDLAKRGIEATTVYVADTATTPDYVAALQASGAAQADAIELIPATVAGCVSLYDAMKQLGMSKPVLSVTQCSNAAMLEKTGGGPANWRITSLSQLPVIETPQSAVFNHVMDAVGSSEYANVGFAAKGFGDIMTIAKFAKSVGFENLSAKAFEQKIMQFRGPAWMIPGDILCGGHPTKIGLCGNSVANSIYRNGKWVALDPYQDVTLERN